MEIIRVHSLLRPFDWKVHTAVVYYKMCTESMHVYMYVHVSLFLPNQPHLAGGRPAKLQNYCWHSCSPSHPQLQLSSNPGAAVVSHMPNDCEPTTGAWSCYVGHWCVLTVPSSIGQTQIIVQQVEDMRQSEEKMVRIKQTLIESNANRRRK